MNINSVSIPGATEGNLEY